MAEQQPPQNSSEESPKQPEQPQPAAPDASSAVPKIVVPPPPVNRRKQAVIGSPQPKKFKEYLFEFFMLFLAVFCGFFAEYKLEEVIEHNKEKQYIQSIIDDIGEDTVRINQGIMLNNNLLAGLDSLIVAIYKLKVDDTAAVRTLYRLYAAYGRYRYAVKFTDRTLAPLKNSGNFRIIRSQVVSDSLLVYDDWMKWTLVYEERYQDAWQKALDLSCDVFDYRYIRLSYVGLQEVPAEVLGRPVLLNSDPALLRKYANYLELMKQRVYDYSWECYYTKVRGVSLIPFLQKEYDIETQAPMAYPRN
jgi:hypothetical protein